MAWVSLNNLTRFYTKLKEKFYLKTEIDTKVNTLNTAISNISTVYYGDGVDSAIAPLNADQLQGHPASYFATAEALTNSTLKIDLLWTNASPGSAFAQQTVSLDLSRYKSFVITYISNTNNTGSDTSQFYPSIGNYTHSWIYYKLNENMFRVIFIKTTEIRFGDCIINGTSTNNEKMIPYKIYGVK